MQPIAVASAVRQSEADYATPGWFAALAIAGI